MLQQDEVKVRTKWSLLETIALDSDGNVIVEKKMCSTIVLSVLVEEHYKTFMFNNWE